MPSFSDRVFLRRLKLGSIPGLRANRLKHNHDSDTEVRNLPSQQSRSDWVQCPCGRGTQDAVHFFRECAYTDLARTEIVVKTQAALDEPRFLPDSHMWNQMTPDWKNNHVLSNERVFQEETEQQVRAIGAEVWVRHTKDITSWPGWMPLPPLPIANAQDGTG